jgi:hypothetical protein
MVIRQERRRPNDGKDRDGKPQWQSVEAVKVPFDSPQVSVVTLREFCYSEDATDLDWLDEDDDRYDKLTMIPTAVQRSAKYSTRQSSQKVSLLVVVIPLADLATMIRVHFSGVRDRLGVSGEGNTEL